MEEIISRLSATLFISTFVIYGTFGLLLALLDRSNNPKHKEIGGTTIPGWIAIAAGALFFVLGLIFIVDVPSKFA